jgi:hypothetical protein
MREPEERYRRLVKDLLWKRLLGPVSPADESGAAEEIDQAWFEMTAVERKAVEEWANTASRAAFPAEVSLVDLSLPDHAQVLPRTQR